MKENGIPIDEVIDQIELPNKQQNLCHEIGQLLSSYAKAINRQEGRTASLFKKRTSAKDGTNRNSCKENFGSGLICESEHQYIVNCFHDIHQNPVNAGLVKLKAEWKYSSASHYLFGKSNDWCSSNLASELGMTDSFKFTS